MFKKRAVMRSYLDSANNAYTECGVAKFITGILLMESLITKLYMHIKH